MDPNTGHSLGVVEDVLASVVVTQHVPSAAMGEDSLVARCVHHFPSVGVRPTSRAQLDASVDPANARCAEEQIAFAFLQEGGRPVAEIIRQGRGLWCWRAR
jgi:hypothetical protein